MDDKRKNQAEKTREKPNAPYKWELTEDDKAFLRSCNVRPE